MRLWPPAVLRAHSRRRAELDARVSAAGREKDVSQRRLEHVRAEVAGPRQDFTARNQFAQLIRNSLLEGHER